MCIYGRSRAQPRIIEFWRGENLSELNERKRFVPFFFFYLSFLIHKTDKRRPLLASDGRNDDDIHRRFGPRELTLSTPHLLVCWRWASQSPVNLSERETYHLVCTCIAGTTLYRNGWLGLARSILAASWLTGYFWCFCYIQRDTMRRLAAPDLSIR